MGGRLKAVTDETRLVRAGELDALGEEVRERCAALEQHVTEALARERIAHGQALATAVAELREEHRQQLQAQQDVVAAVWVAHELRWHPVRSALRSGAAAIRRILRRGAPA